MKRRLQEFEQSTRQEIDALKRLIEEREVQRQRERQAEEDRSLMDLPYHDIHRAGQAHPAADHARPTGVSPDLAGYLRRW